MIAVRKHLYTVYALYREGNGIEELDVVARSHDEARALAEEELREGFLPGWEIVDIIERPDGVLFL